MLRATFIPETLNFSFNSKRNPEKPWRIETDQVFKLVNMRNGVTVVSQKIVAPFDTDLASIPWWLGWAMPANGWHIRGCVFHDDSYKWQDITRRMADHRLFLMMNVDRPKNKWYTNIQTWFVWFILRLTGWYAWWCNGLALKEMEDNYGQ